MKLRGLVLSGLLAVLVAPTASAQGAGTFEFGLFARKNFFGESYALRDRVGGGARAGFFVIRGIELAGAASYTPTRYDLAQGRVDQLQIAGELLGHVPFGDHVAMFVGGRYVYNKYMDKGNPIPGISAEGDETGPGAIAGFRLGLGDRLSVRLDGTADYMSSPNPALSVVDKDWHYGFNAGLSWLFGNNVGFRGVQDADRDGVADDVDQCPDSPRGSVVGPTGCPPVNQDSINAAAERRRMEQARADSMARVQQMRADSIAQLERARADSIANAERMRAQAVRDSAARAAGISAAQIQALRDSLEKLRANANSNIVLPGVNFATGTATLTQSSQFILTEVAASLAENPNIVVEVAGHTDTTGPRALNERLSLQRAESVRNYLITKGIDGSRMTVAGYAWDRPVASNNTRAGRALNRRTELVRRQ